MNNLFLCQVLLLVARASGAAHLATTTTAGNVVTLDWAKCCDCEEAGGLVKTKGKTCEVEITTAHSLRIKYSGATYMHNIIEVPTQADWNSCTIPTTKNATGQGASGPGVKAMDETMTYSSTGTYYYACSVMCTPATGGSTASEFCHCKSFNHKLKVTVRAPTTSNATTVAATATTAAGTGQAASFAQMSSPMAILTSSVVCLMAAFGSWF